jgi:hypothetical protein
LTCCWCRRSTSGRFDEPTPPAPPSTGGKVSKSSTRCTSDALLISNIGRESQMDGKFYLSMMASTHTHTLVFLSLLFIFFLNK